ncbi:hypothetical protein A3K73_04175 [Candidatus Pacearchaeota archaeon RBG_13_36_9]|nr:MAG: hypothetical protein A3K73_04175 [Candidatus Pacearchaeota archaeon RBG_13_36_9]
MNKRWFWLVFVVALVLSLVLLNFLANYKLKPFYLEYYEVSCSNQNIGNPFSDKDYGEKANLCRDSGGCFVLCGSACPPKQRLSILRTFDFFRETGCTEVCVPQCVCKYRYEFNEKYGCLK